MPPEAGKPVRSRAPALSMPIAMTLPDFWPDFLRGKDAICALVTRQGTQFEVEDYCRNAWLAYPTSAIISPQRRAQAEFASLRVGLDRRHATPQMVVATKAAVHRLGVIAGPFARSAASTHICSGCIYGIKPNGGTRATVTDSLYSSSFSSEMLAHTGAGRRHGATDDEV